ncbi:FecR family protein [Achromobacter sp. Marseille-Q4962]|uniref:FecR domain-containing protein n=1 Tax=Achromobacter sp. Marseille-Q4962 TaxID=2942202 RepID=UPI0020731055|nr:FecR family protein [Achromobacter sp. Marseille-Q4962]
MHHGGELRAGLAGLPPVDRRAARQAAGWLLRLNSPRATEADVRACDAWRASKAEHEHAWQRAQRVNARLGLIPAGLGMASLNRPAQASRRAALKTLAALAAAGPLAWAAWRADPFDWTADLRTGVGERRSVALGEGSTLELNTGSAVDIRFDGARRLLRLREGEIAVRAVADAGPSARPFIVRAPQGDIVAHEARFCVRLLRGACGVSVQEGALRLDPARGPSLALAAGMRASLSAGGASEPLAADPHAVDWLRGVLYADAAKLGAFLAELGRYRPGLLRCDPAVAGLRISGAFQLRDTDAVLAALPATLPVAVRYRTPYWVTVGPRAAGA